MSEIDVESVDDVDEEGGDEAGATDEASVGVDEADDFEEVTVETAATAPIDAPEYVLYGGKGGVGKTTMAAASGLASARAGVRTLVVSTDPAHSLSDAYETDVPPRPERIREDVPLYGAEIDPEAAVEETPLFDEEGGIDEGAMGGLGAMLGGDAGDLAGDGGPMSAMLGGSMPGADEAAAMQQLLNYLDDDRFDRVIVDTAPTGHTLRLLELPEVMDSMVGRMLTLRERLSGMIDGVKRTFGAEVEGGDDLDELRELSDRIERLRATLRDPARTDFRAVMVPERMSVVETERLLDQLESVGIPVETVVVNRVMEDLADVTDDVDAAFVSPDLDSCAFCQRRWEVQEDALAAATDLFRGHEVRRVPLFAEDVRGEAMLSVVAACLGD